MLNHIIKVSPEPNFRLRLVYSDGAVIVVNFNPLIEQGGVFTALADPLLFEQVRLGDHGRYIEWNETIDFCADALRRGECFLREPESLAS